MADDIAIGIDLGTSYSCVSVVEDGQPVVHPQRVGRADPRLVRLVPRGRHGAGRATRPRRNIITSAETTVYSAKRLIGRYFFSDEVKKAQAVMPYRIVEGENNSVRIQVRDQHLLAAGDLRAGAQGDEGDRRDVPRPAGDQGGRHRSRLLQRQPAPGHQGRGPHRRAGGAAHPQRAHRGGARLRLRPGRQPADRRLRPGRRHLRRVDPGDRQGRLRGARPPPATRTWAATTSTIAS